MLIPFLSHLLLNICNHPRLLGVCPQSKNVAVISGKASVAQKLRGLLQGQTSTGEPQVLLKFLAEGATSLRWGRAPYFWGGNITPMGVLPHSTQSNLVCEVHTSASGYFGHPGDAQLSRVDAVFIYFFFFPI